MTVEPKQINRLSPWLFGAAGVMWFLAAWMGDQIAFAGIGFMFLMLGLAAWLKARKAGGA